MTIRAVIFDIGGVILLEAGEGLETKWERRLGLNVRESLLWCLQRLMRPDSPVRTYSTGI